MRFHNGKKEVDVRVLVAPQRDYFVANRMVWENLQIGAYAVLEGRYKVICIKQGSLVGTMGETWRGIHESLGIAGLDFYSS